MRIICVQYEAEKNKISLESKTEVKTGQEEWQNFISEKQPYESSKKLCEQILLDTEEKNGNKIIHSDEHTSNNKSHN